MKLRLKKVTEIKGSGEKSCFYIIQKRYFFMFWKDYKITTHYYTYLSHKKPSKAALLTKRRPLFNRKDQAFHILNKIQEKFKENYKGNKIVKVLKDNTWEEVFINKDHCCLYNNHFCYEFSNTLHGLKEKIDNRAVKKTVEYIKPIN